MTLGDFVRNYLNPFYLIWRFTLLFIGGGISIIGLVAEPRYLVVLVLPGLWLIWKGIRPWGDGRGISINDINNKFK